jgi:hypothetical protein
LAALSSEKKGEWSPCPLWADAGPARRERPSAAAAANMTDFFNGTSVIDISYNE